MVWWGKKLFRQISKIPFRSPPSWWGLNRKPPPPLCAHQSQSLTTNHSLLRRIYSVSDLLAFRMKVIVLCHAFRPRPSITDPLHFSPPPIRPFNHWWSPDKNRKQYCTADGIDRWEISIFNSTDWLRASDDWALSLFQQQHPIASPWVGGCFRKDIDFGWFKIGRSCGAAMMRWDKNGRGLGLLGGHTKAETGKFRV